MKEKSIIDLKNISKQFDGETVLKNFNLYIKDGEFVTILGPSGCGKTTILRIIGGFIKPDSGDVLFNGKRINDLPAHKRTVNTIFQKYALFPHLNVYENIAFGMRIQKKSESEIRDTVKEMLRMVNLSDFSNRNINSLSGGQQQRIAIVRSLSYQPDIIIADEPTGNLDKDTENEILNIFKKLAKKENKCIIIVTHSTNVCDNVDVIYDLEKLKNKN